jgi:hypothetical protein
MRRPALVPDAPTTAHRRPYANRYLLREVAYPSSKPDLHELIGGFERMAIACLHGDADQRSGLARKLPKRSGPRNSQERMKALIIVVAFVICAATFARADQVKPTPEDSSCEVMPMDVIDNYLFFSRVNPHTDPFPGKDVYRVVYLDFLRGLGVYCELHHENRMFETLARLTHPHFARTCSAPGRETTAALGRSAIDKALSSFYLSLTGSSRDPGI